MKFFLILSTIVMADAEYWKETFNGGCDLVATLKGVKCKAAKAQAIRLIEETRDRDNINLGNMTVTK